MSVFFVENIKVQDSLTLKINISLCLRLKPLIKKNDFFDVFYEF